MEKHHRPKQTISKTVRMETGCGNLYITVGKDNGKVIEVFAALGKAGSCTTAFNEALTRAISLGLKYGVPIKEYTEELEEDGVYILSCADAIAKVLREEANE